MKTSRWTEQATIQTFYFSFVASCPSQGNSRTIRKASSHARRSVGRKEPNGPLNRVVVTVKMLPARKTDFRGRPAATQSLSGTSPVAGLLQRRWLLVIFATMTSGLPLLKLPEDTTQTGRALETVGSSAYGN